MKIHSRHIKENLFEIEGVFFTAKSMIDAIRKWTRFKTEVKVLFQKLPEGNTYTSAGYYKDQKDFEDRNPTLIFRSMTSKTRPEPKRKENKCNLDTYSKNNL